MIPLKNSFRSMKKQYLIHLIGFVALLWFLIRVIPKPIRASYPCQRAAFPLASAFVLWLMSFLGSFLFFRKARTLIRNSRFVLASICILVSLVLLVCFQAQHGAVPLLAESVLNTQPVMKDVAADSAVVQPRSIVAIVQSSQTNADDIDSVEIDNMVRQAVEMAGGIDDIVHDNSVVVIKPNLVVSAVTDDNLQPVSTLPEKVNSVTTDYRVIQAAVNLVREKNPHGKVYIVEGSAVGNVRDNMTKMGWFKVRGVDEFICLDEACGNWRDKTSAQLTKVSLPMNIPLYSIANNEYYFNKVYYEADVIISLPILKTHCYTAFTGAVKNVGIGASPINIYGSSTINPWRFDVIDHGSTNNYANLHDWIHDFYMCKPVNFAIMDALTGMQHGPNPGNNDPISLQKKNTRCIIASRDPIAMDAIGSLIVQVDPSKVRHLVTLHNGNMGCADPKYIRVKGVRVDQVKDHYANYVL